MRTSVRRKTLIVYLNFTFFFFLIGRVWARTSFPRDTRKCYACTHRDENARYVKYIVFFFQCVRYHRRIRCKKMKIIVRHVILPSHGFVYALGSDPESDNFLESSIEHPNIFLGVSF